MTDDNQPVRMKPWKRLALIGVSVGIGFAVALSAIVGAFLWYNARPKPPKPWNTTAITAEFDVFDTEGDKNNIVFDYTLQNNTESDYNLLDSEKIMVQLERQKSLSGEQKDAITVKSVFIPAKQRVHYPIQISYPYAEKLKEKATTEEREAWRDKLKEYVADDLINLGGFVLFDEITRYQINFPKSWVKTAVDKNEKK